MHLVSAVLKSSLWVRGVKSASTFVLKVIGFLFTFTESVDTPVRVIASQAVSEACNLTLLVPTWPQAHALCALSHSFKDYPGHSCCY